MPGLGLEQGSGLGSSSSDVSPLERDGYLDSEAGAAGGTLAMALKHAFLLPSLSSEVHWGAVSMPSSQGRWISAAEGRRASLTSLLATEHLVIKKNPLGLVFRTK